jgi:predicted amidohydrolase
MRICVAQTRPVKGDVQSNIEKHKAFIELATSNGADLVIFPELSVTSYEPELAKELATDPDDGRFDDFQTISDDRQITIGVGVPTKNGAGVSISMVLFQPHKERQTHSKKYLHSDEEPFFTSGQSTVDLTCGEVKIALAICYELSVPEHAEKAFKRGAKIYIASAAKSAVGVERAIERLSEIAAKYSMTVLMSNCVGRCDNFESAGRSSVWNDRGLLLGQLNDTDEGIIVIDTDTQELTEKTVE